MYCGKCGSKMPDGYAFCVNCGAKANTDYGASVKAAEIEPVVVNYDNNGELVQIAKKNVNKKFIIIGAAVAIAVILVIIFAFSGLGKSKGYWADIPWGTDINTAKAQLEKTYGEDEVSIGTGDYNNNIFVATEKTYDMEGVIGIFRASFDSSGLEYGCILCAPSKDGDYTYNAMINEIIKNFDKKYGKHENYDTNGYRWTTSESVIYFDDAQSGSLLIHYTKND